MSWPPEEPDMACELGLWLARLAGLEPATGCLEVRLGIRRDLVITRSALVSVACESP
jgi:hypothetical protein